MTEITEVAADKGIKVGAENRGRLLGRERPCDNGWVQPRSGAGWRWGGCVARSTRRPYRMARGWHGLPNRRGSLTTWLADQ